MLGSEVVITVCCVFLFYECVSSWKYMALNEMRLVDCEQCNWEMKWEKKIIACFFSVVLSFWAV
jgi:hypothetical protein